MIPSGSSRPTVFCTTTGVMDPVVFVSAELIDLMSLAPAPVLLVFQMGNLFDALVRLMTWSGETSTAVVLRSRR